MTGLTWLDYSAWDRDRAMDVIALLREKETRDELGIGTIRDILADRLFPGTSTLHTRARYFLFIPRIYRAIEQSGRSADEFAVKGRRDETRLMEALVADGETEGVIGRRVGGDVKRLPSSLYWIGLASWGMRRPERTQADYFRWVAQQRSRPLDRNAFDGDEIGWKPSAFWDPALPDGDFGRDGPVDFVMPVEEARYLADKIETRYADSMLCALLNERAPGLGSSIRPWEWTGLPRLPSPMTDVLVTARTFSVVMLGAALVYNFILAQLRGSSELIESFTDRLDGYVEYLGEHADALQQWNDADFWATIESARAHIGSGAQVSTGARTFVSAWFAMLRADGAEGLRSNPRARELVRAREVQLKGAQARVRGGRALDLWNTDSGTGEMNYRWHRIRQVVSDIRTGLGYDA